MDWDQAWCLPSDCTRVVSAIRMKNDEMTVLSLESCRDTLDHYFTNVRMTKFAQEKASMAFISRQYCCADTVFIRSGSYYIRRKGELTCATVFYGHAF